MSKKTRTKSGVGKIPTEVLLIESQAAHNPKGGVARYVRHVARGLYHRYGDGFVACTRLDDLPSDLRHVYLPLRYPWRYASPFFYRATTALEKTLLRRVERRLRPKVIFSPFYGPLASITPQVFTVYDLILHLFPEYFPHKGRVLELAHMRRCLLQAAGIICISNSTKSDLLRLHPDVDPAKVHVTLLGVSEEFFCPTPPPKSSRPYFLFVGTRIAYKNFLRLLEAFAISGLANDFDLRVISPRTDIETEWSETERNLFTSKGIEKTVTLTVGASDRDLATAYAGATAFVQPSEYEGFGLPVLEAMAAGTIVACSTASSLPEAGGRVAFYFDPLKVGSIAACLVEIARLDSARRAERVAAGRERARNMSWEKCANRTCEILESVSCLQAGDA
jgi:glycosyltransferase involved in cell wall biosynthesis